MVSIKFCKKRLKEKETRNHSAMDTQENNDFQPNVREIDPLQPQLSIEDWETSKPDPQTIKLDLETLLEIWFFQILLVAGIRLTLILVAAFQHDSPSMGSATVLMGIIAFFFILSKGTDNYYLIDLQKQQVLYNFNFLSIQKQSVKMTLDCLTGIAVGCKLLSTNNKNFPAYAIFLIDYKGQSLRMTNWKDIPVENANLFADWLGKNLNCPVFPGETEKTFEVSNIGGIKVEYLPVSINYFKVLQIFLIAGAGAAIVLFMFYLKFK